MKETIYKEDAINAIKNMIGIARNEKIVTKESAMYALRALPSAQPDTIPVDWVQKYADDWEDMNYAYDNPILGMLEDWMREQDEQENNIS